MFAITGGTEGVFVLPPSEFDPAPGYPEARRVIDAVRLALTMSTPKKGVCLSTMGAQAAEHNLLTRRTLMEQALRELPLPVTFLRPAWFMENAGSTSAGTRRRSKAKSNWRPFCMDWCKLTGTDYRHHHNSWQAGPFRGWRPALARLAIDYRTGRPRRE